MKVWQAIVILLVGWGVFSGIQAYIMTIDPATVPTELLWLWNPIAYIFTSQPAVLAFTLLRNVAGYFIAKLKGTAEKAKEAIEYERAKLAQTWLEFQLYVSGLTIVIGTLFLGTPYAPLAAYISGGIGLLVTIITRAIEKAGTSE